jgi:hypothetical protein
VFAIVLVTGLASDKLGGCSYSCLFLFRLITGVLPISYVLDYMCIVLSWLIEIMGIDGLESWLLEMRSVTFRMFV